ncbi:MAG TPA: TIGR03790 family protein, partial [Bryobacteraceae bacterium]
MNAQTSHPEVLVVYNSKEPDSLAVASHYLAMRNIPSGNLCSIAPPNPSAIDSLSLYAAYVKTPVQNCLNAVGKDRILYIVMSYLTPYHMYGAGPSQNGAVDSYLADIWDQAAPQPFVIAPPLQPYYADGQNQGNAYAPFVPFASYRAGPGAALIYSVWRLDGPTAAIASGLVDQAVQAEANGGPHGQACIDRRNGDITLQADASYNTGDWDLRQAAVFLQQAGIAVTEDSTFAEFGSAPAPPSCPNTAFYTGWYALNSYNDAFTWQPGSIGWHLDSGSAVNPRGGPNWSANALQRGIAVTTGAVAEPYLEGMVHPAGAWRNLLEGANVGDAFLRNTQWLKWQILNLGDPLYRPFAAGRAPFKPLAAVNSFAIEPRELVGGRPATGRITLSAPAPAGGKTFSLTNSLVPSGVMPPSFPALVTVPAGATQATFPIATASVTVSAAPLITATAPGLTLRNTIVFDPLLRILVPEATSAISGQSVMVHLMLNGVAPAGGAMVLVDSDNAGASVPATVTVPAGSDSTTFYVTAGPANAALSAKITA